MALFISFGIYHCLTLLNGLEGVTFYVLVDEIYILTDSSLGLRHPGFRSPNFTVVEVDGTVLRLQVFGHEFRQFGGGFEYVISAPYTQIPTKSSPEHSHYLHTR
jgi:hypothetical protein